MTIEAAVENLARLAKRIAWSPRSGLTPDLQIALRRMVAEYEKAKSHPTAFDHIMADDDIYERDSNVPLCAYVKCRVPMMNFRHGGRKYHSEECRKKAFYERKLKRP